MVQSATITMQPSDPRVADEVLELLEQYGWQRGQEELEKLIAGEPDAHRRGVLRLFSGWSESQRGAFAAGKEQFELAAALPDLKAWALTGQAFTKYRSGDPEERKAAWKLLERAEQGAQGNDILRANIAHCRGVLRYQQEQFDEALDYLYTAAELLGDGHFGYGHVLDSLGMVYSARDDFPTARALLEKGLSAKLRQADPLGQALSCGQLGRLFLDWGELEQAKEAFENDLRICWQQCNDRRGAAQMLNHLGQVQFASGKHQTAKYYLDRSVTYNQVGGWTFNEAYARKDRALVLLALNEVAAAEADASEAERLAGKRAEVFYHAHRALAHVRAAKGDMVGAEPMLQESAGFFEQHRQPAEAARTLLELASLLSQHGGAVPAISDALEAALRLAERCRRDYLIGKIERDLEKVNPAALYQRAYERARGWGISQSTAYLGEVSGEPATVLFLDLRNFTDFSRKQEPRVVQRTLNQIFAELTPVLERHHIVVNQYLGDGFMAFVRNPGHELWAVRGAWEMLDALKRFNRPRRLLGEPLLEARIGVCSGNVVFGNIGTYRKIDYTAVGPTTNKAARLQGECVVGTVCIGEETYGRVQDEFKFADDNGREVTLKGIGTVRVWDVNGPKLRV